MNTINQETTGAWDWLALPADIIATYREWNMQDAEQSSRRSDHSSMIADQEVLIARQATIYNLA